MAIFDRQKSLRNAGFPLGIDGEISNLKFEFRKNETRIPVPFGNRPATKRFPRGIVPKQAPGIFGAMEIGSKRTGTKWLARVALATAVMAIVGLFGDSAGTAEIRTWSAHPTAHEV
ncbi:MAG TPA: hypothetical protein VMF90_14975 [Rhizobiaceae bacterium]|nr:hypothetical protein [Rhizobiaceae bacterium]